MIKRDPQEIADFFGVYVAQDNDESGIWNIFFNRPVLINGYWFDESEGKLYSGTYITALVSVPEDHDYHTIYEPQTKDAIEVFKSIQERGKNSAPHQSEVHTHREYVLLGEFSPSELCVKVSEYLEKGFKLYGYPWTGPDCGRCGYIHYQAMVRGLE